MRNRTARLTLFRNPREVTSLNTYAEQLERHLLPVAQNWEIKVYQPTLTRVLTRLQPFLRRLPFLRAYADDFLFSRYVKYPAVARWHQGDVNHLCNDAMSHLIGFLSPKRTIITCADLRPLKLALRENPALKLHKLSLRRIGRAARVICMSEATKKDLLELDLCHESRTRVIHLGVSKVFRVIEDKASLDCARRRYGLHEGNWLLHVGLNWEHKNLEGLLKAWRIAMEREPDLFLLKVGGRLDEQQEALARSLGLGGRIRSLGLVPQQDLVAVYNIADVLVYPSFNEGFGLPILEAFACGLPVITSDISSMPEIAGNAAILVDPSNPGDIAGAIGQVLSSRDVRERLRTLGLERARQFTWERTAENTLAVYEDVLRENGNTPS